MTLDTLVRVMGAECCWVQTIDSSKRSLQLVAERGFNREMRQEVSALDMARGFGKQVVGLASPVVIPDLSHDGHYGLDSFRAAGYKWMVAVPLLTYRVHGVLGIASRDKKWLRKETPDLALVIAGLIGTALNRAGLSENPRQSAPEALSPPGDSLPQQEPAVAEILPPSPGLPLKNVLKPAGDAFQHHAHKMSAFRRLHH